jgi:hypothetical protein
MYIGLVGAYASNVGIGTNTPSYKLQVHGGQFGTYLKGGDLGTGSDVVRMVKSDNSVAMLVRGDGNVGIGTPTPSTKLEVDQSANTYSSGFSLRNAGNVIHGMFVDGSNNLNFHYQGTPKVVFESGGNVGIGVTTPTEKLTVGGSINTITAMGVAGQWTSSQLRLKSTNHVDTTGWQGISFPTSSVVNYGWSIGANRSASGRGSLRVYEHNNNATGTERFCIKQDGYVGIGTSSPSSKLQVVGTITATTKNFLIDDPKTGGQLQYSVIESNEHGVCVRGESDQEEIELPEEWEWLVHEDSVTVQLTSIDQVQHLFVLERNNIRVRVGGLATNGQYSYVVYGTRKDVDPLEVNI